MEQDKINRINELARISKTRTLSSEELAERAALRAEYIAAVKGRLEAELQNTYIVDEQGNKKKVTKKEN